VFALPRCETVREEHLEMPPLGLIQTHHPRLQKLTQISQEICARRDGVYLEILPIFNIQLL
jgi:hypothetical protein